ncbi:MAG TPA: hypothetical protein DCQ26_15310 [Marinilabiliales bacterium]|jgi:hypothetical protein|nr:MAG: hypothetical protein A2W95_11050 [Bacteroidetes bacterium GWA2_40_14]OFX57142.1 MAG: hypothetical protein A2W84_14085 [Bacteroidetes bacterium GWC2_40_13]OFX73186.1 MAG: hypothetical protein A2W96_07005 [Bacteroidetes bacterium GWD2_40_43]OFX91741.1 MAG: hypothetical protein A2W97_07765 [Bacteroidetes bacterium GWE2_40_63]OFY24551.1 MAG: hypothetical protein A2W88_17185 [Bacteroidetes bacterium GWF2_40_13]OFZ23812.1 MAG: hypothetical protein A2437_10010 [Bacteroidetes bacterium RIFOXYC
MKQFQASSPNVQVNGETVYAIIDGMSAFRNKALKILADNSIVDPKPGMWFKQQDWLNAFKTISEQIGALTLNTIGQKIPENAVFPPQIDEIHTALGAINQAYHMNHRNGLIGDYTYQKSGEKSGKMVCTNPYPDDFDKGIITAMGRRFLPKGSYTINVMIDKTQPERSKGADSTTFLINW